MVKNIIISVGNGIINECKVCCFFVWSVILCCDVFIVIICGGLDLGILKSNIVCIC